ncbi:hypothetical protein [Stenotrophomonas sp. LM091]|uniref:hypothetical protein n=1 Tax=Stenotrophomonas sp. LM091 TaxID=1904944 RepID=UPI001C12BA2F|nr:hypothetical protein [Stenotrophomonas sp. LM091]
MTSVVLNRLLGVAVLLASSMGMSVGAAELRQAVLVQNSGWMEPFYVDAESPFKPLVAQLAQAAAGHGEVVVGAFNQSDATHPSPEWVYRGPGNHPGLAQAMTRLQMAHKGSGALADTDFKEALLGAIEVGLEGRPGIIWIVTNNKNSPNNSTEVVARNREFYELLHGEDVISRIAAFPLKMPVQGKHYRANGLMLYALAYGEPASAALDAILAQPALTALLPEGHVRLKPLTEAAVRFSPTGVKDSPGIAAGLAPDGHTLVLSFDASTQVRTAQVQGRFENLFNPYRIVSADTSLVTPPAIGLQGEMSTHSLQALDPGKQSDPLTLRLSLPPCRRSGRVRCCCAAAMNGAGRSISTWITSSWKYRRSSARTWPTSSRGMRCRRSSFLRSRPMPRSHGSRCCFGCSTRCGLPWWSMAAACSP